MKPVKLIGTNLAILDADFASCGRDDRIYFETRLPDLDCASVAAVSVHGFCSTKFMAPTIA